jgi:hypothetical protein
MLVVGLSLALAALITVGLHAAGVELDTRSWTLALAGVTVLAALPGLRRREHDAGERRPWPRPSPVHAMPAVLAVAFVVAAGAVTLASQREADDRSRYVQLWITETEDPGKVRIGLRNQEGRRQRYLVQVAASTDLLQIWRDVRLDDGESWSRLQRVPLAFEDKIVASVRRGDDRETPALRRVEMLP